MAVNVCCAAGVIPMNEGAAAFVCDTLPVCRRWRLQRQRRLRDGVWFASPPGARVLVDLTCWRCFSATASGEPRCRSNGAAYGFWTTSALALAARRQQSACELLCLSCWRCTHSATPWFVTGCRYFLRRGYCVVFLNRVKSQQPFEVCQERSGASQSTAADSSPASPAAQTTGRRALQLVTVIGCW